MVRSLPALVAILVAVASTATPAAASAAPRIPLDASSPWPEMRHDSRNTGVSPIVARYHGDRPWAFRTGRGIFSTPVIGGDGTVYVGSADTYFYAHPAPTAGCAGGSRPAASSTPPARSPRSTPRLGSAPLTFGSADDEALPRHDARAAAGPASSGPSAPPSRRSRASRSTGGRATSRVGPGGNIYAGQHGRNRVRAAPQRQGPVDVHRRQLGLDDACRSPPTARASGDRSISTSTS